MIRNRWIAMILAILLTFPLLGVVAESSHSVDDADRDLGVVSAARPPQEGSGTVSIP